MSGKPIIPAVIAGAGVVAAALCPADWGRDNATLLLALALALYGLAALLGLLFVQSRIAWLSLLMAVTTYSAHRAFFVAHDAARTRALVILASVLISCLIPLYYRLHERGIMTAYGVRRAALATVSLFILLAGPLWLCNVLSESSAALLSPMSALIPLPALALLTTVLGLPFLIAPREHESPSLGAQLCFTLLAFLGGLCFTSKLWPATHAQTALLFPMSASALILLVAVLESAWRHANVDELTDLPNRRALRHRFRCLGEDYVLAVLDLDHFKKVNDQYGHDAGDQVLRFVAAQLKHLPAGTAYRSGGEEFVIVGEGPTEESFGQDLERLRGSIAEHPFRLRSPDRPPLKPQARPGAAPKKTRAKPASPPPDHTVVLTVSIGVAGRKLHQAAPEDVLQAADKALYRAKEEGRNRVCTAS